MRLRSFPFVLGDHPERFAEAGACLVGRIIGALRLEQAQGILESAGKKT